MSPRKVRPPVILVVEDVEETRDVMKLMLERSGYRVCTARDEAEGVLMARLRSPGLILMSLALEASDIAAMGRRIRKMAHLGGEVPIVVFCVPSLAEGEERSIGCQTYLARPNNFDQLRQLLRQLVRGLPEAG